MELTPLLDNFEAETQKATAAATHAQAARNAVQAAGALRAAVEALPDEYKLTMPSEDEVARVQSISGSAFNNPELQAMVEKVRNVINLGEFVEADISERASALLAAYTTALTSFGPKAGEKAKKSGGGKSRSLSGTITVTFWDGTQRNSLIGDWTNIRSQVKERTEAPLEVDEHGNVIVPGPGIDGAVLDAVRVALYEVEAGGEPLVDHTVQDFSGREVKFSYSRGLVAVA